MVYNILYIEDLDGKTRKATLESDNFIINQIHPSSEVEKIINDIKEKKPDLLLLDYILTKGSDLEYCNAPTIASTWRSLIATKGISELPIILMSNEDNIINKYRKDYTSHDLFDYAITKENATKYFTEKFRNKCISFISTYKVIEEEKYDLAKILNTERESIHSKLFFYLNENNKSKYEYSRFIFEHVIRCSGLLIGEDILSARLGVSKESPDWEKLKSLLSEYKYTGVFSEVYNRWWMSKIEKWWNTLTSERLSLRNFSAEERVEILTKQLQLNLSVAQSNDKNLSSHYWTICKETSQPLDPFDGIELLEEEFKSWQDKEYVSIEGYLDNIDKYSQIVSALDRVGMRQYNS